jgi:hypothetical protein
MKQKQKNVRTLDTIADNIHKLERGNIIDIGDLLLEAKAQCREEHGHGEWLDWLYAEFEWSVSTAERYMRVAGLSAKFVSLKNLKLTKTTLYQLADHECEEDLPAIINELANHATQMRLTPHDAERVIQIGIARYRFGDRPDATLVQLMELDSDESWYEKAVAALQEREPKTGEDAKSIVDEIEQEYVEAERKADPDIDRMSRAEYSAWLAKAEAKEEEEEEAEREADSILDGTPPALPPPTTPPEPQKLGADTEWEGRETFADAVTVLLGLRTKPVGRFVGMFSPDVLREVGDFLMAVAAADKKKEAA